MKLRKYTEHFVLPSRCKMFWNSSVAFFAILSFLVFFHVILVLIVFVCFGFSSLHHSKWVRSVFILIFQANYVYFRYCRSSVCFVMFHPVIVTVCFSVIYLVSHIIPSSSSLTLHHDCLNLSVTNQTATTQFKSLNIIPLSFILSSSRTQFRHTSNIFVVHSHSSLRGYPVQPWTHHTSLSSQYVYSKYKISYQSSSLYCSSWLGRI